MRQKQVSKTVLPRDLKVRYGTDRLVDLRGELIKVDREDKPNTGAVMLRVFLELAVVHYLRQTGELQKVIDALKGKGERLKFGSPTINQLVPEITRIARARLRKEEACA